MEKLTSEDAERLQVRETIARDDASAICTAAGWDAFQASLQMDLGNEPDIVNARLWEASLLRDPEKKIHIECERWVDARAFARIVAGEEISIRSGIDDIDAPRWQVKWDGSAVNPSEPVHMVARPTTGGRFRPVSEIRFR